MSSIEKVHKLKSAFKGMERNYSFLRLSTLKKIGRLLYKNEDTNSLVAILDRQVYMKYIENKQGYLKGK